MSFSYSSNPPSECWKIQVESLSFKPLLRTCRRLTSGLVSRGLTRSLIFFRAVKTGIFQLTEFIDSSEDSNEASESKGQTDVFGQPISTSSGPPALKKQPECICPNCQRNLAASRFAPHLEKCMGMGRNSSRLASRRLVFLASLDKSG